jgi:membrane-bound lytic murein transglycosylase MltF
MDNTTFYLVALLTAAASTWRLVSRAALGVGCRIGPVRSATLAASISLALVSMSATAQSPPASARAGAPRTFQLENKPWTGDLNGMIERRTIRFLIPHSRTLYYTDKGQERGLSAELARDFERYVNRKYIKVLRRRPITVVIIPTTRDRLLQDLIAGRGDVVAGNLTATAERQRIVDFVAPADRKPVREILVTGPKALAVTTLEDLSGRTVPLRRSSSYFESVTLLNQRLVSAGRRPVTVNPLPDALEDEDVLEMLNAGIVDYAVVDDWKAAIWARVLPKIRVRQDLVLRTEGTIGWAIRKQSPELQSVLEAFYKADVKRTGVIETRLVLLQRKVKQIADNTRGAERTRFDQISGLFEKYGARYHFAPLMLTAQGFQESRLNQAAKSHVGAVGVMQIMPATGAELKVGDIHRLEPNIHAGAKYMDRLMTRYFPDANFTDQERTLFAFASYNAGPGNISRMRRLAAKQGLDPNVWFNNVEIVTASKIGIEPTTYVRNIFKYYVSYELVRRAQEEQKRARESHKATG